MNPFLKPKSQRLQSWREFRNYLNSDMSDLEQLEEIVKWWSQCPLSSRTLDPYAPATWPTGWELVHQGDFCTSAIALGMEQTLLLRNGRWNSDRVKLVLINDNDEDIYLAVLVDNKWILNYSHGEIFDISSINNIKILMTSIYSENRHKSC